MQVFFTTRSTSFSDLLFIIVHGIFVYFSYVLVHYVMFSYNCLLLSPPSPPFSFFSCSCWAIVFPPSKYDVPEFTSLYAFAVTFLQILCSVSPFNGFQIFFYFFKNGLQGLHLFFLCPFALKILKFLRLSHIIFISGPIFLFLDNLRAVSRVACFIYSLHSQELLVVVFAKILPDGVFL